MLNHRNHLMKFKPQDRFKIKLPPIMKKEQKVTLLGLNLNEITSPSIELSNSVLKNDGNSNIYKNSVYDKEAFLVIISGPEATHDKNTGQITLNSLDTESQIWNMYSLKIEILGKDDAKISEEVHIFDGCRTIAPISKEIFNDNDRKFTIVIYSKTENDWVERKKLDFEYTLEDKPLGEPNRGANSFEHVQTDHLSFDDLQEDRKQSEIDAKVFMAIV